MYDVIKDGNVICQIDHICYVLYRPIRDSWRVTDKDESSAIWVVPHREEGEEQGETFYARLSFHSLTDNNKDFPLVELRKVE